MVYTLQGHGLARWPLHSHMSACPHPWAPPLDTCGGWVPIVAHEDPNHDLVDLLQGALGETRVNGGGHHEHLGNLTPKLIL